MSRTFIDDCEREQLHLSGAIQPHGALLRCDQSGNITHASANLKDILGIDPADVIGQQITALDIADSLPARLTPGPPLRWVTVRQGVPLSMFAAIVSDGYIVLEAIPQSHAPVVPSSTRESGATRSLHDESELSVAQQELVDVVADLTGYQRVMYYQFHADGHGEVIAEARDADAYGSYFGLHFPASDIPQIARALYLKNPWRLIPDATVEPVPLLSRMSDPADLTHSDLRSVSVIHRAYLANMDVRSSLSFPVAGGGSLQALIACHHRSARQPDVAVLKQAAAVVKRHAIEQLSFNASKRMKTVDGLSRRFRDITELLRATPRIGSIWPRIGVRLQQEFGADGAMMSTGDVVYASGESLDRDTLAHVESVAFGAGSFSWSSDNLRRDVPGLGLTAVAGAAGVTISAPGGRQTRIWLTRTEHINEISWGGNPDKPFDGSGGAAPISPRRSFETWVEKRIGHSRPWTQQTQLLLSHIATTLRPLATIEL